MTIVDVESAATVQAPFVFTNRFHALGAAFFTPLAPRGLPGRSDGDLELIDTLMRLMASEQTDFTILFRRLADFDARPAAENAPLRDLFRDRAAFDAWSARYRDRLHAQGEGDAARRARMRSVNPRLELRNHMAETAIRNASAGDFGEIARLLRVLEHPFDDPARPTAQDDADAGCPPDWAPSIAVSCSS